MNTTSIVYVLQNCNDMKFIRLNIILLKFPLFLNNTANFQL